MPTFFITDDRFNELGPFEAESREALADQFDETLMDMAIDVCQGDENMNPRFVYSRVRAQFIAGLAEVGHGEWYVIRSRDTETPFLVYDTLDGFRVGDAEGTVIPRIATFGDLNTAEGARAVVVEQMRREGRQELAHRDAWVIVKIGEGPPRSSF